MTTTHKSSSHEQQEAEDVIVALLEDKLGIDLEQNKKIFLADNSYTYMQPDLYSEKGLIVGEVYAHSGALKVGQKHKISSDILKMLLLEKVTGKTYRKIIAVCDEEVKKYLEGKSIVAESVRQFGIEVILVPIPDELHNRILNAQKRQYR